MLSDQVVIGDLVFPRKNVQLFSSILKKSPDGEAFSPVKGPYNWRIDEIGVVIDVFKMPFQEKVLFKILMNKGGVGWIWDDLILSSKSTTKCH